MLQEAKASEMSTTALAWSLSVTLGAVLSAEDRTGIYLKTASPPIESVSAASKSHSRTLEEPLFCGEIDGSSQTRPCERNQIIKQLRDNGLSYFQMAAGLGISSSQVGRYSMHWQSKQLSASTARNFTEDSRPVSAIVRSLPADEPPRCWPCENTTGSKLPGSA